MAEDDYMSAAFVSEVADVRPSLVFSHTRKRQIQLEKKKDAVTKKQKESESTKSQIELQKGLQRPISSENKGFQMLQKMGYKPGEAIGTSATDGLKEPIEIEIKSDRSGLGRKAALEELDKARRAIRIQRLTKSTNPVLTPEEYRRRMINESEERFLAGSLKKCQKACENLDVNAEVKEPHLSWFWPEIHCSNDEESTDEDEEEKDDDKSFEYTTAEKLEMLTGYLRKSYNYCHWCGTHYHDEADMDANCPGLTKDDH